nr:hypothetical protein [Bacteroidota bacterium]
WLIVVTVGLSPSGIIRRERELRDHLKATDQHERYEDDTHDFQMYVSVGTKNVIATNLFLQTPFPI